MWWKCGHVSFKRWKQRNPRTPLRGRVQGSGFRVQGSVFSVQCSGFRVQGSGFRIQGSGVTTSEGTAKSGCELTGMTSSVKLTGAEKVVALSYPLVWTPCNKREPLLNL